MEEGRRTRTIVLYPAPGIGHIISMVELAKLLHQQSFFNFNITILLTTGLLDHPSINTYIHRISTSHPSISFLCFPTVTVTHIHTQSFAATAFQFIKSNAVNVDSALRQISQTSTIKSLVIDLFCTSAIDSASNLGIPVYYFFTSGASVLSLVSYFPEIHRKMTVSTAEEATVVSFKDMVGVEIVAPGNVSVNAVLMPEPLLDREDLSYWEMLYFCENLSKAKGIVMNTFVELEPLAVKAVEDGACFARAPYPPVYCIGPLIAEPVINSANFSDIKCDIPEELCGDNYKVWKERILLHLGWMDIDYAIRKDEPAGITETSPPDAVDLYEKWERSNRLSMMLIKTKISAGICASIDQHTNVKELLKAIDEQFATSDKALASALIPNIK